MAIPVRHLPNGNSARRMHVNSWGSLSGAQSRPLQQNIGKRHSRKKKNGPKRNNLSEIGCFDLLIYCVLLVLWIMSFITTARSSSLVSKHQWVIQGEEGTVPMSRQWCSRPYPMNWRVPLSCWGPLRSWLHHLFGEWKTGFCYAQLSVGGLASAGWCSPHRQSWKGTQQSF